MLNLFWVLLFVLCASVLSYIIANWVTPGDDEPAKPRSIASVRNFVEGGVVAEVHPGETLSILNRSTLHTGEYVVPPVYGTMCTVQKGCTVGFAGFTSLPNTSTSKKCNYCGRTRSTNSNTCPHCGGYDK